MPSTSPGRIPVVVAVVVVLVLAPASTGVAADGVSASETDPATVSTDQAASAATQSRGVNLTLLAGSALLYDDLGDYATFRQASDGPVIERAGRLRRGESLLVAFRSPRLNRTYAATEGPNRTARFFRAVNRTNSTVSITAPSGPSCQPLRVDLRESRSRVLVEQDGPGFAVLLDTGSVVTEGGCERGFVAPQDYEVVVEVPTPDGNRRSTATLELLESAERAVEESRIRRGAPSLAPSLDTDTAVREAARNGTLVRSSGGVRGEVVVLSFPSERLSRAYLNVSGANATARLAAAIEATGGNLALAAPETPEAARGQVVRSGPGFRTLHDARNDTFHLVLDTGRVLLRRGNGTVPLAAAGRTEVEFDLRVSTADGDTRRLESQFFLDTPDGRLRVGPNRSALPPRDASVAVVGTDGRFVVVPDTNLAPGWNLTLRVETPNGTTLATRHGRSRADAAERRDEPAYAFDLGPLSRTARLDLTLRTGNTTLTGLPVAVGERPVLRDAIARRVESGPNGSTVRFAVTAHYPGPGYVVIRTQDGYTGFEVPGDEPTRVRGTVQIPSADQRQEVQLIAVSDADRDGQFDEPGVGASTDPPFRTAEGELLAVRPELSPPSPTPTVTAPPPGTTLAVTDAGAPGFGPLAALLGLLGLVGMLAVRRARGGSP